MTERILGTLGATLVLVWLVSWALSMALDWEHPEIAHILRRVFMSTTGLIVLIIFIIAVAAIWTA